MLQQLVCGRFENKCMTTFDYYSFFHICSLKVVSQDLMMCLSRQDFNKDITKSNILRKTSRRNLFLELKIANSNVLCQNKNYSLDEICSMGTELCVLPLTNEIIELVI